MVKRFLIIGLLLGVVSGLRAQMSRERWVDSVFNQMSTEDKIAQLFVVATSAKDPSDLDNLTSRIIADNLGGIVFNNINVGHAATIAQLQTHAKIPLLIAADGLHVGLGLEKSFNFPNITALGAIDDDSLLFYAGKEVGRQFKLMGIQLQFISANIGKNTGDTFGDNPYQVASKALSYWRGLQANDIMACAKYFPVQGVNVTQVQKGLPSVELTVDSAQAHPFKVLFKNNVPSLMAEATALPLFYTEKKTALKNIFSSNTLSAAFAGAWIQKNMRYSGLIMIDIERMKKASNKFSAGDAEVFAFQAGNDMLVVQDQVGPALRKMKKLLRKQKEFIPQLDNSVKKILSFKYDAGLSRKKSLNTPQQIAQQLQTTEALLLERKLYEASPAIVSNQRNTLPVQSIENKKFTCIVPDDSVKGNMFYSLISKYVPVDQININAKTKTFNLSDTVQHQHVFIVPIFANTKEATLQKILPVLKEDRINHEVIICDFGSAAFRSYAHEFPAVITAHADDDNMLNIIPQMVFGALPVKGVIPTSFGQIPSNNQNPKTTSLNRLAYSFPEDAAMDQSTLDKIESIAKEAIDTKSTPGCVVLVARKGKVIYEKAFGHLTYEKQIPVDNNTIYDLASVTKVSATLQTVMFMYDKGLIDINKKASYYLPELQQSNKKDFILKDILTHQAGLWPFLPFWAQTMKDSVHLPEYYSKTLSAQYPLVVADNLYGNITMKDSLWRWIITSKIREKPARTPFDYRYSDMGFYILKQLAEKILNQPIEDFLQQNLYEPLGATTTGYLPLVRFPVGRIAPTENDKLFRKALLIGTVHDQGAAMFGGIAGHAGLFSSANDIAKLCQMLLQEGKYGGIKYYNPETVRLFTKQQFNSSRRGLGWDRPVPSDWNSPTALQASMKTFGHTGFTGTCIWMDPEFDLVYVFLSNRVHPDMTNNKLLNANIRSRIQEVIYQSIFNYCKTAPADPKASSIINVEASSKSK